MFHIVAMGHFSSKNSQAGIVFIKDEVFNLASMIFVPHTKIYFAFLNRLSDGISTKGFISRSRFLIERSEQT